MNKIDGGIKFFEQNYALFRNGGRATATSNGDSAKYMLDISRYTRWESIGSNDLTSETITIDLGTPKRIDTLLLSGINLKEFSIKYSAGATFLDFSNVVALNGKTKTAVNETAHEYDAAFYQFDPVTVSQIQIIASKTQVADQQKIIGQMIATEEIGTLLGFPRMRPLASRNETKAKALSRRYVIQKTYETNRFRITFKMHPYQNDEDIIEKLFDRDDPFLVYPCGGRTGKPYFKIEQKGWRAGDIYNVQTTGRMKNEYERGVYSLGFNKSITLEEHV